jgi:TfoX/Sxy family transcriptional regulator of competence genes
MFGGKGVYHRGFIIAVEVRGRMLLKDDPISAPDFEMPRAKRWNLSRQVGLGSLDAILVDSAGRLR